MFKTMDTDMPYPGEKAPKNFIQDIGDALPDVSGSKRQAKLSAAGEVKRNKEVIVACLAELKAKNALKQASISGDNPLSGEVESTDAKKRRHTSGSSIDAGNKTRRLNTNVASEDQMDTFEVPVSRELFNFLASSRHIRRIRCAIQVSHGSVIGNLFMSSPVIVVINAGHYCQPQSASSSTSRRSSKDRLTTKARIQLSTISPKSLLLFLGIRTTGLEKPR